ncbi:MAG: hypothetical protein HQL55_06770 [Magnetococcales bacterium]|nr:hypothetical protein [Magnetococcales bacterium]
MTTPSQAVCPHCGQQLSKYAVAPFNFSDGLGWGTDVLLVCFNDTCPVYVKGWTTMLDRYGQIGSQRYFLNPEGNQAGVLPVGSRYAMKGDVIPDDEAA